MWSRYRVKYRSFIVLKFSSWSASAHVHLSQLGTSLRILSCAKLGSCVFIPLRTAISTSSLLWNLHHARCCFVCPNKWSVRKCDNSSWQCTLPETELLQLFDLDPLDTPCVCSGHWGSFWEVTDCRKMREWKWLFMNGCKCTSLISATVEFLSFRKGVVDTSNFLGIILKK